MEARVSVQAIKGRFEQLHDDAPPTATPTPRHNPPFRLRSASLAIPKPTEASLGGQDTPSGPFVSHGLSKSAREAPKNRSFFGSVLGARGLKSARKASEGDTRASRSQPDILQQALDTPDVTPQRRVSEGAKPSVVRKIPVFKSNEKLQEEGRGGRKSHSRSLSHGNFIIMRDPAMEARLNEHSVATNKENIKNMVSLFSNLRQKSSDNLFITRDTKSDNSFEGKQKLVATVVKNMKNKEKPKLLRKVSFTSKSEKDIKNIKEKAVSPKRPEKQQVLPMSSPNRNKKCKDQIPDEVPDSARKNSVKSIAQPSAEAMASAAAVAKAVANIAASKTEGRTTAAEPDTQQNGYEEDVPERPPRRRSGTFGILSRKKNKAPSPPSTAEKSPRQDVSEGESFPSHILHDSFKSNDIHDTRMLAEIQFADNLVVSKEDQWSHRDKQISADSLESKSPGESRRGSPVTSGSGSPSCGRRVSPSSQVSSRGASPTTLALPDHLGTRDSRLEKVENTTHADPSSDSEKTDKEVLPAGPPPKKPPRTFAYDIYKNLKVSHSSIEMFTANDTPKTTEGTSPPPIPVYAIPLKKKKSDKLIEASKPPIQNNSEQSKIETSKPTIAPKPSHIKSKVKRASLVDPLSTGEKDEESAVSSEFQRQAHVRYSLRRPKKPPPAPPQGGHGTGGSEWTEGNAAPTPPSGLHDSTDSIGSQGRHHSRSDLRSLNRSPLDFAHDREMNQTPKSHSSGQSLFSTDSDNGVLPASNLRITSRSTYNLRTTSPPLDDDQPTSLTNFHTTADVMMTGIFRKRSMSDETLYKGVKSNEEPIYATPIFPNKGSSGTPRHRELHYMCSVLFTDEEENEGRDGTKGGRGRSDAEEGKGRPGIISAWKREFRQSCRHVQNKIKKSVIR